MPTSSQKIGLMGGTFDPVHCGHISIAESFLKSGHIDELWIILTPNPPHKPDAEVTGFSHRLNMLELVFENWEKANISEIENELPKPSFTIQTIEYLEKSYPEYSFLLCIGSDSLLEFHTWHRWQEILNHCRLLVAKRADAPTGEIDEEIREKSHFITHDPVEISATQLRHKLKTGEHISRNLLPQQVLTYIREHNLYSNTATV